MTITHSAADLRGISLANVARWDGDPSKTSQIVSFFPIENRLSIASRAARGLATHVENVTYTGEKCRSTANFWRRSRLDATRRHRRKVWQTSWLRSRTVRCGHGEMAL